MFASHLAAWKEVFDSDDPVQAGDDQSRWIHGKACQYVVGEAAHICAS